MNDLIEALHRLEEPGSFDVIANRFVDNAKCTTPSSSTEMT